MNTTSPELLRRSHDAIDGLALDVRSAGNAAERRARFREFSVAVAMHSGCLRAIVMPALASSRPSEVRALVLENLQAVDDCLLGTADVDVVSGGFNTRFAGLEALLELQFELEARLLFPLLLAARDGAGEPLAQRVEIYGARKAAEAARDPKWLRRGLR